MLLSNQITPPKLEIIKNNRRMRTHLVFRCPKTQVIWNFQQIRRRGATVFKRAPSFYTRRTFLVSIRNATCRTYFWIPEGKTQLESAASRLPNQCLVFCERDDIFRAFQKGRRGIVCFRIYCCNGLQQIMTVVKSFIAPAKRATYARGVALPQHLGSSDGMLNF